jgi:hypothetical protein
LADDRGGFVVTLPVGRQLEHGRNPLPQIEEEDNLTELKTVCVLSLLGLSPGSCLSWWETHGEHFGHVLFLIKRPSHAAVCWHHLQSVPSEGIVGVVTHMHNKSGYISTANPSAVPHRC